MERVIRPLGNGQAEMICTCTSISERDQVSSAIPLVLADTQVMEVGWLSPMTFRIAPGEKAPEAPTVAAPTPAAAATAATLSLPPAQVLVDGKLQTEGTPASEPATTPSPLPLLLQGDKKALTDAKLDDLEAACAEASSPVVFTPNKPRANLVAEILNWRDERGKSQ